MVHALSVNVERDRETRQFKYGNVSPWPARLVAWGGMGLAVLGGTLSFAGSLDPVVGLLAMFGGFLTSMTALVIAFQYARSRLDLPGGWWLTLWRSRAGELAARLAACRLRVRPAPEPQPPEIAMLEAPSFEQAQVEATREMVNQVPAVMHLATSRIQRIDPRLEGAADGGL